MSHGDYSAMSKRVDGVQTSLTNSLGRGRCSLHLQDHCGGVAALSRCVDRGLLTSSSPRYSARMYYFGLEGGEIASRNYTAVGSDEVHRSPGCACGVV